MTAAHVFEEKNIKTVLEGCKNDILKSGNAAVRLVVTEEEEGSRRKVLVRMKPAVKHDGVNSHVVFSTGRPQLTVGQISQRSVRKHRSLSTAES